MFTSNPSAISIYFSKVFLLALTLLPVFAYAAPTVTVMSPKSGASAGSPVFYQAYAVSPACAKGISSMRIYTAPGVIAYSTRGGHVETFLKLNPGTYNTVIQTWDNCGASGNASVIVTVNSTAGVTVFMPNTASASHPVHIAASAQNSACAAGISLIRIYTASGITPYSVRSNQLDAYVSLVPGTYNLTIQAWDKCSHVFKSQLTLPVTTTPDAYLYAVNLRSSAPDIYQFKITSNGAMQNPNGTNPLPEFPAGTGADTVAVDPGGWFVYASSVDGIYSYQINQSNGALMPVKGSPFPLQAYGNGVAPSISVDPSGNYLFTRYGGWELGPLMPYRIDRSSGALTDTGYAVNTAWISRAIDTSGQYVYVIDSNNFGALVGYRIDPNTGNMTTLPGNPYYMLDIYSAYMDSVGSFLYVGGADFNSAGAIDAYVINYTTGVLTPITGSPFAASDGQVWGVLADSQRRFLWAYQQGTARVMHAFGITPGTGVLAPSSYLSPLDPYYIGAWAEDHAGKYVFTSYSVGSPNTGQSPGIATWPISSNGDLLSQSIFKTTNPIGSIAVARKNPN